MRHLTGMPIPNTTMARLQIAEEAASLDRDRYGVLVQGMISTNPRLARECLTAIIDGFMQRYPLGRGTKGNPALRSFYAACYSIKHSTSRTRRQCTDDLYGAHLALSRLPKTARALLLEFTDASAAFKMNKGALGKLIDADLVDGTFYENGSPHRVWLSEKGLAAQTQARRDQDHADREARVAAFKVGDTYRNRGDDFFTSGIDIGDHGNAIVVYRRDEADAIALRDRVLELLKKNA